MRTSPIYYIAPSAISITPNANESPRDLAINVARGAKIKVCYQPIAELGYDNASWKEWTIRGRNRRLADADVPYTIYARLKKTDRTDGYIVLAPQTQDAETGEWHDPYLLSPNTSASSPVREKGADGERYLWEAIPKRQAEDGRTNYWWIKIGTVAAPDSAGQRTVDLDTGTLGTDQYNMYWYIDPDNMPQRPVRVVIEERGEWTNTPMVTYTGITGSMAPDGTLDASIALSIGWIGKEKLHFDNGQEISEPYHFEHLTRNRWLTNRLAAYNNGYTDAELYEKLTTPSRGWEEENWVETSRVWYDGKLWECRADGTTGEPSTDSPDWLLLMQGGEDGDSAYNVELTKSSDSVVIDPSGNIVGGYRVVSKDKAEKEFYSYRFFTSVTVMKGGEYLHLCGALDENELLGEGNFTVEAIGAGCELKMEGTTCYITGIWHCNDGDAATAPYTSYNRTPEEYQMMRAMTEAVAHITMNIEGKTAVTKDYRLQLVHLPTDTVSVESHNEVAALNWSTKKNAWTNKQNIVIPLTASSAGQPVRFQTVNGQTGPDILLLNKPDWLSGNPGYTLAWVDYKDGSGKVIYKADQHMAVEITIPIANIKREGMGNTNLLKFNVTTVVDGVEYENVVPFTLNMTVDKAIYVLAPSVRQVTGTMIGGTWDPVTKTITNSRYSYVADGKACDKVTCRLMCYDANNQLTEITSAGAIHDALTFFINGAPSSLDGFRNAGVRNTAVAGKNHNLFDELSEIVFAIKLDGNDYESEGVPILRNAAQLSIGDDGNWYIGGVNTEVFAKGTEVIDTKIYYTDPMDVSTPPDYAPAADKRGEPVSPYLRTTCPDSVEGKFIHYVSITIFSDSEETYVYSYGTIGTGNTITVIHDRDFYASPTELTQAQLKALAEADWSESTPANYSAYNKYLYARDTARYYKNGAEQKVTVGGIAYPRIVYTMLSYWGQDGSGVEFIYYLGKTNHTTNQTQAPSTPASSGNGKVNGKPTPYASHIDDWVPDGWTDNPQGIDYDHQIEWVSQRTSRAVSAGSVPGGHQWSGFSDPQVWAKWGKNGQDGDGVEYVFIRTKTNVAPVIVTPNEAESSGRTYLNDEYLPTVNGSDRNDIDVNTGTAARPRCTDDPKGTSRDWPYEWVAKRSKAAADAETGTRKWNGYSGTMALWSTYTTLRLDIDNEMDMVPTDSAGKVTAARTVETVVHLYDVATEVNISSATLTVSGGPGAAIATYSEAAAGKGKKLSWAFKAGQQMADAYDIDISYTYNGTAYSATLTVTASKGQAVYQLKPSQSSIVYSRNADNTLSSADNTLKLAVVKIDGASSAELTPAASGQTIRYSTSAMPSGPTVGTAWPAGNSITVASNTDNIYIAMFSPSGVLLDRETVPVVCDGGNGENAVVWRLLLDRETISPTTYAVVGVKVQKVDGKSVTNYLLNNLPAGITLDAHIGSIDLSQYIRYTSDSRIDGFTIGGGQTVTVQLYLSSKLVDAATVMCVSNGANGAAGHVGRWYYYAGPWTSGVDYTMQETQAPFVMRRATIDGVTADYFFMLDYGTSNKTTGTTRLDPATNYNPVSGQGSNPWTLMQSQMQYYIGKAFFSEYAQFGSFIINGDWLISTNGTLNGGTYNGGAYYGNVNAYTYFDPDYPLGTHNLNIKVDGITGTTWSPRGHSFTLSGRRLVKVTGKVTSGATMEVYLYNAQGGILSSTQTIRSTTETSIIFPFSGNTGVMIMARMSTTTSSHKGTITAATVETFAPNYALDGLTGKAYMNDAYVRGTVNATMFYSKTITLEEMSVTVPSSNTPFANTYYLHRCREMSLPRASDYDGLELNLYCPMTTRSDVEAKLISSSPFRYEGNEGMSTTTPEIIGEDGVTITYAARLPFNTLVKLLSIGKEWLAVIGRLSNYED